MAVDPREQRFAAIVKSMLADPEWLLPIVAGHRQFRSSYYGLTSAALLEDVWYDALANWMHRTTPNTAIRKTTRGQTAEAGDYVIGDLPFGHKSGDGPVETGVHWDPRVAESKKDEPWYSDVPLVFLSTGYDNLNGLWQPAAATSGAENGFKCRATWGPLARQPSTKVLALVEWPSNGQARVLDVWNAMPAFTVLWERLVLAAASVPLNHLDLLWIPKRDLQVGDRGALQWKARPGFYIFSADVLRAGVEARGNNRARTLKRDTIIALMRGAVARDLWAPIPMWYANFAPPLPPDLYLPLRTQYDGRFSPTAWKSAARDGN